MHQLRGPARAGAGQSATRRPAIRRRKLQPSAPPPAVGGALAANGSPPGGWTGIVVEAAWGSAGSDGSAVNGGQHDVRPSSRR